MFLEPSQSKWTTMKVDIDKLIAALEYHDIVMRSELFEFTDEERKVIATSLRVLKQAIGRGPFITGTVGEKDTAGLHNSYWICPTLGLEGSALYKKSGEYTAPEW
jgi:hypothetical protein